MFKRIETENQDAATQDELDLVEALMQDQEAQRKAQEAKDNLQKVLSRVSQDAIAKVKNFTNLM